MAYEQYTPNLMKLLPWYYSKNATMGELQGTVAEELGKLNYNIEDLINQLFIDTATWGLSIYEKAFGLQTNTNIPYAERREIIKAKLLGRGTTTKQMIKDTAEVFSGGEVDIIEYPAESKFVIKFVGTKGIPRNMQGFEEMLEAIKPAHLAYELKFTYSVWNHISNMTWGEASEMTWDELRTYEGE